MHRRQPLLLPPLPSRFASYNYPTLSRGIALLSLYKSVSVEGNGCSGGLGSIGYPNRQTVLLERSSCLRPWYQHFRLPNPQTISPRRLCPHTHKLLHLPESIATPSGGVVDQGVLALDRRLVLRCHLGETINPAGNSTRTNEDRDLQTRKIFSIL